MSDDMVCIPRKVFGAYWPKPFSEILHAAERGKDGLAVRRPHFTPSRDLPPRRDAYREQDEARFRDDLEKWKADQDVAFMYEADSHWRTRDKAILYQQNWSKP